MADDRDCLVSVNFECSGPIPSPTSSCRRAVVSRAHLNKVTCAGSSNCTPLFRAVA